MRNKFKIKNENLDNSFFLKRRKEIALMKSEKCIPEIENKWLIPFFWKPSLEDGSICEESPNKNKER